ncbi:Twinfilin [Cyphellophora attinorum]|uniref:Twinfilin n=1 Tax=Cyphellophora attinorum TaxID=1664694 RepID=A0A0N0NLU0_9EURO|nr:Twinfilin [Phialophora attinorum]KPI39429.1 Twinfilin [Phialophora attinorum]
MQSGITGKSPHHYQPIPLQPCLVPSNTPTASRELHAAFASFLSDSSAFYLPVTITRESLTPLSPVPFASSGEDAFTKSLPSLSQHLEPKTPIYLMLRRSPSSSTFTAITYVPSTAPVRAKTLFGSTRISLVRELGLEKFEETLFVTDAEEVLEAKQWADRAGGSKDVDENLLSREERELQSVKRAEEEARHGTQGTALGGLGGGGGSSATSGGSKLSMKMTAEARTALQGLASTTGEGAVVQLGIDISTETLTLLSHRDSGVQPTNLASSIPSDRPSYTFYRHPSAPTTALFVYVCPGTSKVKERMVYASSRSGVLEAAKSEGVEVSKRLEAGDPEEITAQRLDEEVAAAGGGNAESGTSTPRGGFSRPKRPGKR